MPPSRTLPKLPIGEGDTVVKLSSNRDQAGLPKIYQTFNHPKQVGTGKTYYTIEELTYADMSRITALEKELKIPQGPKATAIDRGQSNFIIIHSNSELIKT